MKLEMLNPHAIYLHDTPSKGAFGAEKRAFSHGCIRTEKALHFSGLMAVMFAGASPEEFGEVVESGQTQRFGLAHDRTSVVAGKRWVVRVDPGGCRILKN